MRTTLAWILLAACGGGKSPTTDATSAVPDAFDPAFAPCDAAAGTAHIAIMNQDQTTTFAVLQAGAVENANVIGMSLMFVNEEHLLANTATCCLNGDGSCCGADGLTLQLTSAELGAHDVVIRSTDNHTFAVPGTLTLGAVDLPFDDLASGSTAPGRVSGHLAAATDTVTLDGSFDGAFCPSMVRATAF